MTNWDLSKDIIDQDIRYMDTINKNPDIKRLFDNWAHWVKTNLENILASYAIPKGFIIQAGTWNGDFYNELKKIFGNKRCIGFDIENYIDDPSIIYGDFRKINSSYPFECAVFYNGLGSWDYNKKSKQAGLEYAIKNLVKGGLYLDVIHQNTNILKDIPSLKYCNTYDKKLIILKKI